MARCWNCGNAERGAAYVPRVVTRILRATEQTSPTTFNYCVRPLTSPGGLPPSSLITLRCCSGAMGGAITGTVGSNPLPMNGISLGRSDPTLAIEPGQLEQLTQRDFLHGYAVRRQQPEGPSECSGESARSRDPAVVTWPGGIEKVLPPQPGRSRTFTWQRERLDALVAKVEASRRTNREVEQESFLAAHRMSPIHPGHQNDAGGH